MHLDDPVDQDASHSLRDLGLVLHVLVLRLIVHFSSHEVLHNISGEFSNILRVLSIILITLVNSLMQMHLAPCLEFFIDTLQLLVEPFPFILFFYFVQFFFAFFHVLHS